MMRLGMRGLIGKKFKQAFGNPPFRYRPPSRGGSVTKGNHESRDIDISTLSGEQVSPSPKAAPPDDSFSIHKAHGSHDARTSSLVPMSTGAMVVHSPVPPPTASTVIEQGQGRAANSGYNSDSKSPPPPHPPNESINRKGKQYYYDSKTIYYLGVIGLSMIANGLSDKMKGPDVEVIKKVEEANREVLIKIQSEVEDVQRDIEKARADTVKEYKDLLEKIKEIKELLEAREKEITEIKLMIKKINDNQKKAANCDNC